VGLLPGLRRSHLDCSLFDSWRHLGEVLEMLDLPTVTLGDCPQNGLL
jgi:hypothetical protein